MKRFICSLAVIFALLPLSATADSLPPPATENPIPLFKVALLEPLPQPTAVEVARVAEIPLPAPEPVYTPPPAPVAPVQVPVSSVSGCGDNFYANYIYTHESGCNAGAINAGGCYGIGQACPGSKVAYCGTDYACQNAWFSDYANKYGGWAGAYDFWVSHGWW